jgi:hypothetical protein
MDMSRHLEVWCIEGLPVVLFLFLQSADATGQRLPCQNCLRLRLKMIFDSVALCSGSGLDTIVVEELYLLVDEGNFL